MAEESLDPKIYGQDYVDLVDKYREAGGEKFTVEETKSGPDFKAAQEKMNAFIASKEKEAVDTGRGAAEFKGDRAHAKKTWEYLTKEGTVDQDLETWLGGIGNDTRFQTMTHNYLRERGVVDQDFNTWREGFSGIAAQEDEKSPTFLVDGKTLDINGVEVSTSGSNTLKTFETEEVEGKLIQIEDKVNNLRKNPLLFPKGHEMAGQVDTEATNKAIKEVQNTAPSLLSVRELNTSTAEWGEEVVDDLYNNNLSEKEEELYREQVRQRYIDHGVPTLGRNNMATEVSKRGQYSDSKYNSENVK